VEKAVASLIRDETYIGLSMATGKWKDSLWGGPQAKAIDGIRRYQKVAGGDLVRKNTM